MIDFEQGQSYNYPYPYMVIENCFDKKTLNNLINEFPDVSSEGTVMGGRKKMNVGNPKFNNWIQTSLTWNRFYQWLNNDSIFSQLMGYYSEDLNKWHSVIKRILLYLMIVSLILIGLLLQMGMLEKYIEIHIKEF